jgi:signal transduction histidine kinase
MNGSMTNGSRIVDRQQGADARGRATFIWVNCDGIVMRVGGGTGAGLSGLDVATLVGRPVTDLVAPAGRRDFADWFRSLVEGAPARGRRETTTAPLRAADGVVVSCSVTGYLTRAQRAEAPVALALRSVDDVALEQLRHELTRLQAWNHQLAASNGRLTHFAFMAAHELRRPLASMSALAEQVARVPDPTIRDDGQELLGGILREVGSMKRLLDGLLDLARSPAEIERAPVDADEVVAGVVARLRPHLTAVGGRVHVDRLGQVEGQAFMLAEVFENLLANATSYRSPERDLVVCIGVRRDGPDVVVRVIDNGRGIAPADRQRVFEPFQTVGDRCGTGLGLPICRRIVEAHGGRMWIEDGLDGGTAVVFTLGGSRP